MTTLAVSSEFLPIHKRVQVECVSQKSKLAVASYSRPSANGVVDSARAPGPTGDGVTTR